MCLILLAYRTHPDYELVVAANRDEYHDRPTARAAFWEEVPQVLAGRDLRKGGTWLGITRTGRIAALTNYRDPASSRQGAPSRGRLVSDFLLGQESAEGYLKAVAEKGGLYNGFNLLVGDRDDLWWYSNRGPGPLKVPAGVHGLSNHLLDTPWPKVSRGQAALAQGLSKRGIALEQGLLGLLQDRTPAHDPDLPETGVGPAWERILSPIFIARPAYGTRSSTVLLVSRAGAVTFVEKTHKGDPGQGPCVRYEFRLQGSAGLD